MPNFKLNEQLSKDCILIGEINSNLLLLMNNSLVPWFILVPKTSEIEIIDLTQIQQNVLQESINLLAKFVKKYFNVSKLNIATIGNIVNQLHIHVIGRDPGDYCWPNVVWGSTERKEYDDEVVVTISVALKQQLNDHFVITDNKTQS